MSTALPNASLDQLFRTARTPNAWLDTPVTEADVQAIYELAKWGATSANCQPGRYVFVRSAEAKQRLKPMLSPGNQGKTMRAPVVAIIGYDLAFYENLPRMFPNNPDAINWFRGKGAHTETTAFRNGSLQGAYLMLAARALGFDCGPMSGFDAAQVDAAFWNGTQVKTNFICAIGHADPQGIFPRNPRLAFDEAARIV